MAQPRSLHTHLRGLAFLGPLLVGLFQADVVLSLLLPLRLIAPRLVYDVSSCIAQCIWAWIQSIFTYFNGARISISGDPLPPGESAIVIANHIAWSDFYLIQALAQKSGMLGRCRYFSKAELRYVPFLGWGIWAIGMPLVSRNWLRDKPELDRVFSNIVQKGFPTWLVSFSEGTRFTKRKYAKSLEFCRTGNRRQPMHLLYPRTKGFVATVQHLRSAPHVKAVYDFTIAYQHRGTFQSAPSMWETLSEPEISARGGYRFHVRARRFPIESLPTNDEELATWLEQLWVEKGEWLEAQKQEWEVDGGGWADVR